MEEIKRYEVSENAKNDLIRRISERLSARPEIEFAYLYGSFLEGGYFRDIDVAIYAEGVKVEEFFDYEDAVASELKQVLNISAPIDVRLLNRSPIVFRYNVLKGKLIVNNDDEKRVGFVVRVLSRYLDLQPILQHHQKEVFIH